MDARLQSARLAVRTATRQAHAALVSSDAAVYGDPAFDDPANGDPANGEADHSLGGDDGGDDWSDRAGSDLGVQLFGTSESYVAKLEEDFAKRLTAVEGELDGVQAGLAALEHGGGGGGPPSRPERAPMDDDEGEEIGGELAAEDVPTLKRRIAFLRRCQAARKLLEDADRLSASANCAAAGGELANSGSGGGSPGSVAFHSPTSLCGPGDFATFAFEAGAPAGGNEERPLVRAAGWVAEAERLVEEAGKDMMMDGRDGEGGDGDGQARMQAEMLDQLTQSALRQRTELRHRAATLIQSCVVIEENGLLIRGGGTAEATTSKKKKAVTFDVQESPMAASPPSNEGKAPPSPLGDAYGVLDALADPAFPSFGQTLDGAMRDLARTLYEEVLKPCLDALDEAAEEHEGRVAYYQLTREMRKHVRSAGEAASVRGPAARLGWTLASASCGGEGADAAADGAVATAADIDEKALQTAPPNVSGFLASLNLLCNVLTFVHEHALLGRSDLAAMLGKHLFGAYPKVPSTLLGAEDAPLMGRLLEAMRKRCLPVESCPEAWRAVRAAEARLGIEAGAFERQMAEMGLMMEAPGVASRPQSPTAGAPTSPAGLSALADSPIQANDATAVDGSAPDVSLEVATDVAVRSPPSELARSLRRAYVESRRGAILNRGRAILLDADYHNTVDVGVDAPDLSEPGALASLDDDRLAAAFALPRCAVSTTAQQILDLARETLDAAAAADDDSPSSDRPEALRPALYRAARGLFDLFRALPAARAGGAESDPRAAAVLHNDGVYLAHAALLLGAEYKGRFRRLEASSEATRLLGETCTFLDMVPPLRDLATTSMGRTIELQKGRLCEGVAPRLANFQRALASNEAVAEWDDADAALRGALHHLRRLSQAWRRVLSRQIYNQAMGNLVDVALTLYLDPVMKAEDISESASRFLHALLLDGTSGMLDVFIASGDDAGDTAEASLKAARKYSALFGKAQAVGQFMPMRLDEIERGCEEGVFSSVSAKELAHLILAAFDDVPKRAALLNNLATQP